METETSLIGLIYLTFALAGISSHGGPCPYWLAVPVGCVGLILYVIGIFKGTKHQ